MPLSFWNRLSPQARISLLLTWTEGHLEWDDPPAPSSSPPPPPCPRNPPVTLTGSLPQCLRAIFTNPTESAHTATIQSRPCPESTRKKHNSTAWSMPLTLAPSPTGSIAYCITSQKTFFKITADTHRKIRWGARPCHRPQIFIIKCYRTKSSTSYARRITDIRPGESRVGFLCQ